MGLPLASRSKSIDAFNQALFGRYLRRLLRAEKVRNFILWSFRYNSNVVMQVLRPDVSIYHSVGRFNNVDPAMGDKRVLDAIEGMTMRAAHLVFTSSDLAYRQIAAMKKETFYAPMGVDFKLFHTALRADLKPPDDLAQIPEPRVGYIGHMEHWLDLGLLEHLVEAMPDVSFVFIGRYGPWLRLDPLMSHRNVFMMGPRPRASLPGYLQGMRACLIPFKINELTLHSHPMKIYEYLAAGKPVVSTPLPEVEKFAEFIGIARDRREFAAKLRQAVVDRDINRANARAEIARHYSWDRRVAEMLEHISGFVVGAEDRPWQGTRPANRG
jgi:glycosyltransferase involved in cell wall biosynthesis